MGVRAHAQVRIERSERVREPEGGRDRGREGGRERVGWVEEGREGGREEQIHGEKANQRETLCAREQRVRVHTHAHTYIH